jgi:DNA polymerase-1
MASKSFVMDLETRGGKDPDQGGDILIAGVSRQPGEGIILEPGNRLGELLANAEEVIGQYFYSYDAWWLHKRGYTIPPRIVDTQVLGHLANPSSPNDLRALQAEFADPPIQENWKEREHYAEDISLVCCQDVDATKRVELGLWKHFGVTGQQEIAEEVIIPWCRLAFELRRDGIRCDLGLLQAEAERIGRETFQGGERLALESGVPLPKKTKTGLPSPQAIKKHLYKVLQLPVQYHRKTGKETTDEKALRKLRVWCQRNGHKEGLGFIEALIGKPDLKGEWVNGLKQNSTLAKDFAKYAKYDSPILHAEPNLTGTETGRLSYQNPNLQQVPKSVRCAFLPDEGHIFVQFDYKQVEFLIMLYMSEQWNLLQRGLQGQDFHEMAAQFFFNLESPSKKQRDSVKPYNFGIIYGKGVKTTAEDLDKSIPEVQALYDKWFEMIPGILPLRQTLVNQVKRDGYYQSPFGWRRYFSSDEKKNTHRGSVQTQIYNTPIQSTAGIQTRKALVDLWRELPNVGTHEECRMVLTVHDSGVYSVTPGKARRLVDAINDVVSSPCKVLPGDEVGQSSGIRFPIDIEWGENWGEMKSWETFTIR